MDIKSGFKSMLKADKRLSDRVRLDNLPRHIRRASEVLAESGDSKYWWPMLIVLWLFGNTFWKEWVIVVTLGIGLLALVTWPVKQLVKRKRPIGFWSLRTRDKDPNSFPSGHAAHTFLLATLATSLGPPWLAVIFWIWAPLVSLAHVAMGVHFLSNTIGSMLIGILVWLLWPYLHEAVLQVLATASLQILHLPL
ncbi:MAG TPA: phosphatase PAP2 family protein [Anaerolineales bacterium]|nr:phosphatase PAP2 family protein [Anaerolineales bacterium]